MTNATDNTAAGRGEGAIPPPMMSKLAITTLVVALLSCIPGVGLVAAVLGIVALYRIGRAGGRMGGKTLAGVGMAIGLIASSMFLALALGLRQEYAKYRDNIARPMTSYFQAVDSADVAKAQAIFAPGPVPTEEQVRAFGAEVREKLGAPVGPLDRWPQFAQVRQFGRHIATIPADQPYTGAPIRFEKGLGFVLYRLEAGESKAARFPESGVSVMTVLTLDGETLRLEPRTGASK